MSDLYVSIRVNTLIESFKVVRVSNCSDFPLNNSTLSAEDIEVSIQPLDGAPGEESKHSLKWLAENGAYKGQLAAIVQIALTGGMPD